MQNMWAISNAQLNTHHASIAVCHAITLCKPRQSNIKARSTIDLLHPHSTSYTLTSHIQNQANNPTIYNHQQANTSKMAPGMMWRCPSCGWMNPPMSFEATMCIRCGKVDAMRQFVVDNPVKCQDDDNRPPPPPYQGPPGGFPGFPPPGFGPPGFGPSGFGPRGYPP
ncbi:hypothetical protein BKA63DRAFT_297812 [Paraphoma chrysanthemicola]|nr:hypothetical protein BKA63DRAFT_297812 [Paraphoma chrysanthemicola]